MPGSSRGATGVHVCRPDAFEDELEESLATFYDADLGDRIKSEVREARERAQDRLVDAFEEHRAEIQDALDELHQGLDRYDDEMGPHVDAAIDGLPNSSPLRRNGFVTSAGFASAAIASRASSTASITGPSSRRWTYRSPHPTHRG